VEWVETIGRTLEEAKEAALDQLGVDERDAEFEVLAEPRTGLFGRVRGEARVRARIRPTRPRPKSERRDRRRKPQGAKSSREGATRQPAGGTGNAGQPVSVDEGSAGERSGPSRRRRRTGSQPAGTRETRDRSEDPTSGAEGSVMDQEEVSVERQAEHVETFVIGLLEAFGVDGNVHKERVDDETIEVRVEGEDLGLLIGPKGQTLNAIQDLGRTVVQRHEPGLHLGRVRIDISGYRQRRREALERFTRQVAEDVLASGLAKALEPMNPADRKVVHDTANTIAGVATTSEGVEPHRRVVILPDPEVS